MLHLRKFWEEELLEGNAGTKETAQKQHRPSRSNGTIHIQAHIGQGPNSSMKVVQHRPTQ